MRFVSRKRLRDDDIAQGEDHTMREIRAFLLFEAIAFALASLVHRGLLVDGLDDPGASTAYS